jgi:hypothetical protein
MITNKKNNFQDQSLNFHYAVTESFFAKLFSENEKWTFINVQNRFF